jgi:hypothetical protein
MTSAIVVAAGVAFIALGSASLVTPSHASRFLLGFAGSPAKHYVELAFRFLVGGAFVLQAPHMLFPRLFGLFGWVLLATTTALLLVPWRWHQRLARRIVPVALRFLPLVGASSMALGGLVLVAVFRGYAA